MDIWLVRHGATEWSRSGRHTGSTDLPLLPEGEAQARVAGSKVEAHGFARVLSSPMARALETARVAGFADRVEATDLLREVDYGEFEGRTTADIRRDHPGWELFRDGCPRGESPAEIAARMDRFLGWVGHPDGDLLLFGHGHCLRALATRYLALPIPAAGLFRLDAGSLSILGHEHDHRALTLWNEACDPEE
jgi:broad specificity phosphatase PhoE